MRSLIMRNPGEAVYGVIAVGALLAAESPRRETYVRTVAAVLVTLLLYWLAHAYADLVDFHVTTRERLTTRRVLHTAREDVPILIGAIIPLVAVLIWWAGGASLSAAVAAAVWTSAAMIVVIEFTAGVRAGDRGRSLLAQTCGGALLGSLVVLLHVVLH
jgi:hypothetical protein